MYYPKVFLPALATVLLSSTAFADTALNDNDLQKMHETYVANQARFAHDYVGKTFAAPMLVSNITENLLNRGNYFVVLGGNSDVSCLDVTGNDALAFNKEDTVN
jgi:hypothetical protein